MKKYTFWPQFDVVDVDKAMLHVFISATFHILYFLVPVLQSNKIISEVFPLHCTQSIEELRKDWVQAFFSPQPLGQFPPLYRNAQNKLMELSINHNPYDESVIFFYKCTYECTYKYVFLKT